jgi:hypothetical protein
MRSFIVGVALAAMLGTVSEAAKKKADKSSKKSSGEDSGIVETFPDTANNLHVYLFKLSENHISLHMSAQEFCRTMGYGDAVSLKRGDGDGKVDKENPRELDWVICRFKPR